MHRHQDTKKPAGAGFLLSEHIAWRYVFERLAIVIEHTFQDFAQFHRGTPTICYTGVIVFALMI
ncbi:hypothetical protein C6986_12105 [Escherichia coli]|nr:hypothetical protein C6986_12105 [Escherichia coli]